MNIIKCQLQNQLQRFRREFTFFGLGHAPGVGLEVLWVKIFSVGISDGAPSTARSS